MALVHIADLPLVSPIGIGLCPSLSASLSSPAISIPASLTGSLALNAPFSATPPTLVFYLGTPVSGLIYAGAKLAMGASLGIPDCSFGANISAGISVVADISASITLALTVGLPALSLMLGVSIGVYSFTYVGPASGLGA